MIFVIAKAVLLFWLWGLLQTTSNSWQLGWHRSSSTNQWDLCFATGMVARTTTLSCCSNNLLTESTKFCENNSIFPISSITTSLPLPPVEYGCDALGGDPSLFLAWRLDLHPVFNSRLPESCRVGSASCSNDATLTWYFPTKIGLLPLTHPAADSSEELHNMEDTKLL